MIGSHERTISRIDEHHAWYPSERVGVRSHHESESIHMVVPYRVVYCTVPCTIQYCTSAESFFARVQRLLRSRTGTAVYAVRGILGGCRRRGLLPGTVPYGAQLRLFQFITYVRTYVLALQCTVVYFR